MATKPGDRKIGATDASSTPVEAIDEKLGELPLAMIRAIKAMIADVAERKGPSDASPRTELTAMHGIAARYVDDHDDVTVVELATHLHITKQSASEIVAALE